MNPITGASFEGRALTPGVAEGPVLWLGEALSFWGGLDPHDGRVIDRHHPRHGATVTGRILVMPTGRGSSSSSSVLAEAIRLGTAPAGLVLGELDAIIALGALAAAEMYGTAVPVAVVDPLPDLGDGAQVRLRASESGGAAMMTIIPTPEGGHP